MRDHAADMQIRTASPADAALLADLSERTFRDTFAADNTAEDMEAYVASAFGESVQRAELGDPRTTFLLAEEGGRAVGYAKLIVDGDSVEISRLYAIKEQIGRGVGAALMDAAIDEASRRGCARVWLGVWERNLRAIRFYEKCGFRRIGEQQFILGEDVQNDLVLERRLR